MDLSLTLMDFVFKNADFNANIQDDQVAGYVTAFSGGAVSNFTFATVKGSGHMVPQFQPKRGFELFRSFITATAPLY